MDPGRIRVSIVQISAATLSLCPWLRPARGRDRQGRWRRKRRAAASVGFTVAMETVSSLLNTCFGDITRQDCPLKEREILFNSIPTRTPKTGQWCVCVCVVILGGVSEIIMTNKITEAETQVGCESWWTCGQHKLRHGGLYLFCLLWKWPFYYPCQNKKSFLAGRWGSWACRFNL